MQRVLGKTNDFLQPSNSKILWGKEPRNNENFVIANIFCLFLGPSLYRGSAVQYVYKSGPQSKNSRLDRTTLLHLFISVAYLYRTTQLNFLLSSSATKLRNLCSGPRLYTRIWACAMISLLKIRICKNAEICLGLNSVAKIC